MHEKWAISSIIVDMCEGGAREELGTAAFRVVGGGSQRRGGVLLTECHAGRLEAVAQG